MKIDHIGFVVEDIADASANFCALYGYRKHGDVLLDFDRKVKLLLLYSENDYCIELIQPLDSKSPAYDFMKKGGGMHHICYGVSDIESAILQMKSNDHMLIERPKPALLFNRRKVAFLYAKFNRQIVELLESEVER